MPSLLGKQAVVVGAGIGGLTAAGVLADYFERVVVLERDAFPERAEPRSGVPQGKHPHALLAGGQRALDDLFPGFTHDLLQAGAVPLRVGLELRIESPGYDPFPQRDLGWDAYAQSRAQLELCVRQRLHACTNIELRQRCRVQTCVARADGKSDTVEADLVIDASGRGTLTLGLLESMGWALPEETMIGVDLAYATAIFTMPEVIPEDWKGVFCFPQPPQSSLGALLLPMEGERWIVTVARMHGEALPEDRDGFIACVQQLRTPTIYNALAHTRPLGEIARFQFPASEYRHYERLEAFPRGLLPLGDALCRFNPIYGQGMSVAAQEARALRQLLAARAGAGDPLHGLAPAFFAEASALIEAPWAMAAIPDFAHPDTRGERPVDLEQRLKAGHAMNQLAARDPAVHKLREVTMSQVQHRVVETNGMRLHIAEQGAGPLVVLCHGFPECWYSWRHQLPALAEAGFHTVAPDMRGYGQSDRPDDIDQYTLLHLVGDMIGLLDTLGVESAVIVGHDWGAPVAWHAALLRPDRFRAVIGLSVPFIPRRPVRPTTTMPQTADAVFYQLYFQTPGVAEAEFERDVGMTIRGLLYSASGDTPRDSASRANPDTIGMVPRHGGLLSRSMVPPSLPPWLTEADIDCFVGEFTRTGFRGGLNWYRNIDRNWELLAPFAGACVNVPALYIAGDRDLVVAFRGMDQLIPNLSQFVPYLQRTLILPGCGHWTQQERPEEVNAAMIDFLRGL